MYGESNLVPRALFPTCTSKAREKRPKDEVVFEGQEWGDSSTSAATVLKVLEVQQHPIN